MNAQAMQGISPALAVVAVVVIAALVVAAIMLARRKRREDLRRRFGNEYDRVLRREGNESRAERELLMRERRIRTFSIRPLGPVEHARFNQQWLSTQNDFVDDPGGAVAGADQLVQEVMRARGYPVSDFEQNAADLSVDHATVVDNYRAAHALATRHAQGQASTEDLRRAMVFYRELFQELLRSSASEVNYERTA